MNDYITLGESVFISLVSIVVVFIVLVIISLLIYALSFIKDEEIIEPEKKVRIPSTVHESFEISEEIVAAISAALLCVMESENGDIHISNIKKIL